MENNVSGHIDTLFQQTSEYVKTRVDLYKLKAVDKSSDVLATVISKMIVAVVFIMFIFLINIGIALLLGNWLGRSYYGFFVLAGFYLIAGFIFKAMRKKWFKEPIANEIIRKFFK